jgi:hypothetical protein
MKRLQHVSTCLVLKVHAKRPNHDVFTHGGFPKLLVTDFPQQTHTKFLIIFLRSGGNITRLSWTARGIRCLRIPAFKTT